MPEQLTSDQMRLAQTLQSYGYNSGQIPRTGGVQAPANSNNVSLGGVERLSLSDPRMQLAGFGNAAAPGLGGAIGNFSAGNTTGGILSLLSGGFSDILGGLFGDKDGPSFQPYVDAFGNYVASDPRYTNPVPTTGIPGATQAPSAEYSSMANQVRLIGDLLPYYSQAISAQKIPDAMGQLAADTATTGPRLALQEALQRQYGPIFDTLNSESNLRKSMANASNDATVLAGPGQELIRQALAAAKMADPEYYASRAQTSDSLSKLLQQTTANLGTGLSATERDEVGRGLALDNSRRGTANAPSQLNTVANAMSFGAAGTARENDRQNQLAKAIAASTAFLPAAKSGVDVFQVATGKPSYASQDNRFNTNTATDSNVNANSLLNTSSSMWNTNTNNNAQMALQNDQQNDWGNRLGQISSAAGSFGALLMCWVAREVYGAENPRWLQFRDWVVFRAPDWFFNWYAENGESFAAYIHDKPLLKRIIRWWMDSKINKEDK